MNTGVGLLPGRRVVLWYLFWLKIRNTNIGSDIEFNGNDSAVGGDCGWAELSVPRQWQLQAEQTVIVQQPMPAAAA